MNRPAIRDAARRALYRLHLWRDELRFGAAACGWPWTRNERRLLALKNSCAGRRCFIIGNGPSLNRTPLEKLRSEVTIACNAIFLLFEERGFRPTFYSVEDVLVAQDRAERINELKGFTKIFPTDLRRWLRPDPDTMYVNFPRRYRGCPRFSDRFERRAYWGATVTFLNLRLAYYLGCREIYLVGIDHTFVPPAPQDVRTGPVITSRSEDPNHFHPGYFGPGFRWHAPQVQLAEAAYRAARDFLESRGVTVCNATVGGNLEVFRRVDFDSLFRER